jgi:Bacterial pre-peptidase C-terminal domain
MAKQRMRKLVAAVAAVFAVSGTALAQERIEGNESLSNAQPLEISSTGTATVHGAIGNKAPGTEAILDVDFYSFPAKAGDKVRIMINGGIGGESDVDTVIYLFGPNGWLGLDFGINDDPLDGVINPGSTDILDSRIDYEIPLDGTGTYIVAVTGVGMSLNADGSYPPTPVGDNGDYTLVVSGLSVAPPPSNDPPPPVPGPIGEAPMKIRIDVEPGERNNVVRDKERHVTVALLSSEGFNAMDVDPSTLRFGVKGDEASLRKCEPRGHRVDRNRSRDLVCHFKTRYAGFTPGDVNVVVRGKTRKGQAFEGHGKLKYVERRKHRDDRRGGRDDD